MSGIKIDEADFAKMKQDEQNVVLFKNTEEIKDLVSAHKAVCQGEFATKKEMKLIKYFTVTTAVGIVGAVIKFLFATGAK